MYQYSIACLVPATFMHMSVMPAKQVLLVVSVSVSVCAQTEKLLIRN